MAMFPSSNNEVRRWGEALLEADTDRVGTVEAMGVDETLFWRKGRFRTNQWSTSVVDVGNHQLKSKTTNRTRRAAWPSPQPARSEPDATDFAYLSGICHWRTTPTGSRPGLSR